MYTHVKTTCMPPAAKKKKLSRAGDTSDTTNIHDAQTEFIGRAAARCKLTAAYTDAYSTMTITSARQANRKIGTAKWYRLNKEALVAILVANQLAQKIQNFFRGTVMTKCCRSDGSSSDHHPANPNNLNKRVCPISLVPIAEIDYRHRFVHGNTWFNRDCLVEHMFKTGDFANPVTRVEFREEDVLELDPQLIGQFQDRKQIRASLAEKMEMVQSVENEMEEVFQNMVEAAEEIPFRREFTIVFNSLSEDFQQCHDDLAEVDRDRSVLALKSLADVIRGDPVRPTLMSRKRERILRDFLRMQSYAQN